MISKESAPENHGVITENITRPLLSSPKSWGRTGIALHTYDYAQSLPNGARPGQRSARRWRGAAYKNTRRHPSPTRIPRGSAWIMPPVNVGSGAMPHRCPSSSAGHQATIQSSVPQVERRADKLAPMRGNSTLLSTCTSSQQLRAQHYTHNHASGEITQTAWLLAAPTK